MCITQLKGDAMPGVCDAVRKPGFLIINMIQTLSDESWGGDSFFLFFSIFIMSGYFNICNGLAIAGRGKSHYGGFSQGGTAWVRKQVSIPVPPRLCQAETFVWETAYTENTGVRFKALLCTTGLDMAGMWQTSERMRLKEQQSVKLAVC